MSKLNEVYSKWYDATATGGGGIFKDLASSYSSTFEWLTHSTALDLAYYGNHSGEKTATPIINHFISQNTEETDPTILTSTQRTSLATMVATLFQPKWEHLYALLELEYNPIENYSMTQTETPNISHKHKASDDYEEKVRTTLETDQTVTSQTGATSEVYGFNSTVSVPDGESSGSSTVNTQGDAEDNEQIQYKTQEGYTEDTETGTRTLVRSGNVGVTTSQQMAESEIALWQWVFFEQVFKDVDTVLGLQVYSLI